MRKRTTLLVLVVAVLLPLRPAVGQGDDEVTAEQVAKAIERGVKFLKENQAKSGHDSGSWTDIPEIYHGGITPLCTLALINSGCGLEDEAVKRALDYLRKIRFTTTYSAALQTMVFCAADPQQDILLIRKNVKWLEDGQLKNGEKAGGWAYPNPGGKGGDNSNSQFALEALYEAQHAGATVSEVVWSRALDFWKKRQNEDGSWGYEAGFQGTGSMTSAGIASMIIAEGEVNAAAKVAEDEPQCCEPQPSNEPVKNGLGWLARNFSVHRNPGPISGWLYYYLGELERTGRMTGQRFIGLHDWYREGAKMLVTEQAANGAWPDFKFEQDPLLTTSFALLFLARGRRPVALAELKHGSLKRASGDGGNPHPQALLNLTSYGGRKWHRDLVFQIIDPRSLGGNEMVEAPVLLISGREFPECTLPVRERLRAYVDRGGFLLAEQCCGGLELESNIRSFVEKLFPEDEFKLKPLAADHPVWSIEEKVDMKYRPELWGIDVGGRTRVIYCPSDLSCSWALARPEREPQFSEEVEAKILAARTIGLNVLKYASGGKFRYKLEKPADAENPTPRDPVDAQ